MGIFGRLGTVFKSNINDLISKMEDPEKMLNQMIIDMKEQLVDAKKQVAVVIADEKRLKMQFEEQNAKAQEWEKKAMMAVRAGDDNLAREALARKTEHENRSAEFKKLWEEQKGQADTIRDALRLMTRKIEEAERKKNLLIAKKRRAEAQKTIHATMSGLTDNSAFDTFDRMSQKIEQQEAEAQAMAEMSTASAEASLDEKFKKLEAEQGPAVDDALAALKAKMGMPAGQGQKVEMPQAVPVGQKDPSRR
jgi:phage shock protein A